MPLKDVIIYINNTITIASLLCGFPPSEGERPGATVLFTLNWPQVGIWTGNLLSVSHIQDIRTDIVTHLSSLGSLKADRDTSVWEPAAVAVGGSEGERVMMFAAVSVPHEHMRAVMWYEASNSSYKRDRGARMSIRAGHQWTLEELHSVAVTSFTSEIHLRMGLHSVEELVSVLNHRQRTYIPYLSVIFLTTWFQMTKMFLSVKWLKFTLHCIRYKHYIPCLLISLKTLSIGFSGYWTETGLW